MAEHEQRDNNGLNVDAHNLLRISDDLNSSDEMKVFRAFIELRRLGGVAVSGMIRNYVEDSASGLLRYHILESLINTMLEKEDAKGLFFITDIVKFKAINDTHGQSVGNEFIKATAQAFTLVLRTEKKDEGIERRSEGANRLDGVFKLESAPLPDGYRVGGDEFATLLYDFDFDKLDSDKVVADKLAAVLRHPKLIEVMQKYGVETYGIRAAIVVADSSKHNNFDEVLADVGPKENYTIELNSSINESGLVTIVRKNLHNI